MSGNLRPLSPLDPDPDERSLSASPSAASPSAAPQFSLEAAEGACLMWPGRLKALLSSCFCTCPGCRHAWLLLELTLREAFRWGVLSAPCSASSSLRGSSSAARWGSGCLSPSEAKNAPSVPRWPIAGGRSSEGATALWEPLCQAEYLLRATLPSFTSDGIRPRGSEPTFDASVAKVTFTLPELSDPRGQLKVGTVWAAPSRRFRRLLLKSFCISLTGRSFLSSPKGWSISSAMK
mmetsp:Transcript_637/g.2237  ORF Transcript_637/g.2237 Transcript_637/m.2237 type:complete len:235 (+) Transcript_637:309-1013(+)